MAKIYNGLIRFSSTIKPTGPQPLDDRTVVEFISDLTNIETFTIDGASIAYRGMLVSVLENDKVYLLKNKDEITNLDSWVAIGSNNDINIDDEYINQLIESYLNDNNYTTQNDIPVKDIKNGDGSLIEENGVVDLSKYYYSRTEIDDKLESFDLFVIGTSLPTENIDENKIYVINSNNTGEENIYSEYIYVNNNWEKIGEFKSDVDLSNYCTKDELVTNSIKLSSDIKTENEDTAKYASGSTVQSVLSDMHSRLNTINTSLDVAISGGVTSIQEGVGIDVDDSTKTSPLVSIKISNDENNALTSGDDNGLYVENLKERLEVLENLLSAFTNNSAEIITTKNIGQHAITSINYDETVREEEDTEDIVIKNNNGEVKIALNSITNIAYNDGISI